MKTTRKPFYFLIFVLVATGFYLSYYRHANFDVPWLPGEKQQVWSIEAKVEFEAQDQPAKVSLAIPSSQDGFEMLAEHTASAGYGLSYLDEDSGRKVQWTIRKADGPQILYYRVDMLADKAHEENASFSVPKITKTVRGDGPYETSARVLLEQAVSRSADSFSLTRELIREFNARTQSAEFLSQDRPRIEWLVSLLQHADVPAREVFGLNLEDGRRRQRLVSYLQVFDADQYQIFDPDSGRVNDRTGLLLWEYNSMPLIDLLGGENSSVSFSMIEQEVPLGKARAQLALGANAEDLESSFLDFSIHSLPLEEQALFKGILLIPVGVLVVVFMRIFVGLKTSGTFMPVLIAMAFIQTSLVTGLVGFVLIVSAGLVIRSYLSRLNLLLVARISTVIILVIILISALSVMAYKLGLTEGLKVTFFPMIILSWTIERMSILWEEEGPKQVMKQAGGSLSVAVLAYMFMTNDIVRHLTFNFLGLQLVFMAVVLALGGYTGYRLLEFRRFKPFYNQKD